ncbi:MAG: hypothetical protein HYV09_40845 [Deltaproteobacteria bacterium]|nr:hypothetical protein [Deltaproteobacteria bacterium]
MIAVADFARARCRISLDGGVWSAERDATLFRVDGEKAMLPFVACLEEDAREVQAALRKGLERAGLSPELEASFPYAAIADVGLSMSAYWIDRALDWIEVVGASPTIRSRLEEIVAAKRGTQRQRQRARRLLRQGPARPRA